MISNPVPFFRFIMNQQEMGDGKEEGERRRKAYFSLPLELRAQIASYLEIDSLTNFCINIDVEVISFPLGFEISLNGVSFKKRFPTMTGRPSSLISTNYLPWSNMLFNDSE